MSNRIKRRRPAGIADARPRIDRALADGDIAAAATLATRLVTAGSDDSMLLNLAAWSREEKGDYAGAHRLLARALKGAPGDPLILGAIGAVLRKEGRLEEALELLDRVVAATPHHGAAWLERGYTLDALRREGDAGDSYRRALAVDPTLAPALGKLADAAAKAGRREEAGAFAARALALSPHDPAAVAATATLALEARDPLAAERQVRALLAHGVKGDDRTRTLTLLGDTLDRQDRTAEAFACWREAQAHFRDVHAAALAPTARRLSHRAFVERIAEQLNQRAADAPEAQVGTPSHLFLLGYPRSGTTLAENVLASAPGVAALEEQPTLAAADDALLREDGTMPDLATLDAALLERLRADYWARVAALGADPAASTFVDMNPFNGMKLPIIARLFPAARVLVMRRDPRDVVLSCFRINFAPTAAAWSFSDLVETARHYDALTRLVENARERLPLAFHDVRYDRLVTDFERTVRDMAAFAGIAWTDDFHRFDRTARTRGVQTASATQVRRGLYDGRGQWRRYARELAPVLPILQPWVERFGFDPA